MLRGFLEQSAEVLWQQYGERISTLKLVFPSKRARLFFAESLSKLISKPIWQPEYLSIDDLIWRLSPMQEADHLRLVAELYKIYGRYHTETFDKFYSWGVMLLQDFDTIDKYMVDARALFCNISDLHDIESRFADDSEELEIVRNFWRSFATGRIQSREQQEFLKIWRSLSDIYLEFKARLADLSIAYPGMAYRSVAESMDALYTDPHTYCFLGFNALNECEQRLFKFLDERDNAIFLWDYSTSYVEDKRQEAGRFIRRNISCFPESFPLDSRYNENLQIEVIASPTDVLQCKALYGILEDIHRRQGYVDKETAVVLTDENLLHQVITSIPECVERINITMGYPIVDTLIYNFLERLLQLQLRRHGSAFYHKDVIGLLSHPYLSEKGGVVTEELIANLTRSQRIYIEESDLGDIAVVFTPQDSVEGLQSYFLGALSFVSATEDAERREYTYLLISTISKLRATILSCTIQLTIPIYTMLLRQILRQVRVPYTGEPLGGLQVMGILETRNVDFRNVIVLSVNDDNFPGNRGGQSYIPYNLRQAYNLPTTTDAEAMYAYYFYRLIQKADNLTMLYTSATDEKSTGEQSRYIYQLESESQFNITRADISLKVERPSTSAIIVEKSADIISKLKRKRFSPSSLSRYITCPLQFYLRDVERVISSDGVDEEFTKLDLGNALHRTMEILYTPIVGKVNPQSLIRRLDPIDIETTLDRVMGEMCTQLPDSQRGQIEIARGVILKYIGYIVGYDARRSDRYIIQSLEHDITCTLFGVEFAGTTDRIDRLEDGSIAIVDYKSGLGDDPVFRSVEQLFDADKINKAALQILLYSVMYRDTELVDVVPQLYICRLMGNKDFSPLLESGGESLSIVSYEMNQMLREHLQTLLKEIFDEGTPFTQRPNDRKCEWCDFAGVCSR